MSHKNNKNSKENKKAGEKTKPELEKMHMEASSEIGLNNEAKKLGHKLGLKRIGTSKNKDD